MRFTSIIFIFSIHAAALSAFDFEFGQFFERINNDKQSLELAFRTYQRENITVQLIATFHTALPEFYDRIGEIIRDKYVIYENYGESFDDIELLNNRVAQLKQKYQDIFQQINVSRLEPNQLGMVRQKYLKYDNAERLIHADFKYNNPLHNNDDAILKTLIKSLIQQNNNEKTIEVLASNIISNVANNHATIDSIRSEMIAIERQDEIQRAIIDRNNIIFSQLKLLMSTSDELHIAIIYGSVHMPFIEQFLAEHDFLPLPGGEEWATAASWPSP